MEQLIGSMAVIMGVLRTELAAFGARWHPFGLGFAVVAMVRMPIFPDPHPSRPSRCGVSPYALPQNFGREFPGFWSQLASDQGVKKPPMASVGG